MAFCRNCGKEITTNSEFCQNCGAKITNYANPQVPPYYAATTQTVNNQTVIEAYKKLANYEKVSGVIWLIIGIIQCITLVGIICGIWNIVVSVQRIKFGKQIETTYPQNIYNSFKNQISSIIIMLILNMFLGAFIGVIGAIFDLVVRNFVMKNQNIFDNSYPVPTPNYQYVPSATSQYNTVQPHAYYSNNVNSDSSAVNTH